MSIAAHTYESALAPANRRASHRVRVGCTAVVWGAQVFEEETPIPEGVDSEMRVVQIDSLSLTGLSLVSLRPYPVGAPLWIRIRLGAKTCQFKGVVRRSSASVHAGRTMHRCGVQFVRSQQTSHAVAIVTQFIETAQLHSVH